MSMYSQLYIIDANGPDIHMSIKTITYDIILSE